jgi:small redox-active disulfide protein 2
MKIEILGMGCQKCDTLLTNTKEAVKSLGIQADFSKVSDFKEIAKYGVMVTPALVVNGVVKTSGKVSSQEEIVSILKACD